MAEYLKRETLLERAEYDNNYRLVIPAEAIKAVPAADVAPVVHGRWIADGDGYHWTYNCSICAWKDGYPFNERHNFCPTVARKWMDDGRRIKCTWSISNILV